MTATKFYTVLEVADILRLPEEWDRERWVRTRCKDGRLKSKVISRGVYRVSERALAEFMEPDAAPSVDAAEAVEPQPVTSLVDGLSERVRRGRMRSA